MNRAMLLLGALVFFFVASSVQACVFADGDCIDLQQSQAQAMAKMQCHTLAADKTHKDLANHHSQHSSSGQSDNDCCLFMPADLVDFGTVQISNASISQIFTQAFFLHFDSLPLLWHIDFEQGDVYFSPPESPPVFRSPAVSSPTASRAPPSTALTSLFI